MRLLICTVLLLAAYTSFAQTYVSFAPSLTNEAGTIGQKTNIALEVGQQWDVFSLGLDIGQTTLRNGGGKDTSTYLEIRPNLNVFEVGKFTNTFTAGIGYIFGAKQTMMTELTYGIEYACTDQVHFNVFFGNYYYSGVAVASTTTFFGISAAYYFKAVKSGALFKPNNN